MLPYGCWETPEWFEVQEVMYLMGFRKFSDCKEDAGNRKAEERMSY